MHSGQKKKSSQSNRMIRLPINEGKITRMSSEKRQGWSQRNQLMTTGRAAAVRQSAGNWGA